MATSTLAHIVDTLVDLLDNDTTWQVVRVFAPTKAGTSTKPTLYPYVVSISYPSGYENGKNDGYGTAACEIIATAKVANDASGAGLGTIETGRIAKEVMRRLLDADVESIARNDDGVFYTRIIGINVDGHVGAFDNNDGVVQFGLACTVIFNITRK